MFSPKHDFGKNVFCSHKDTFLAFAEDVPILSFNLHK